MSTTNMNSISEPSKSHVLQAVMEGGVGLVSDDESNQVNGPLQGIRFAKVPALTSPSRHN